MGPLTYVIAIMGCGDGQAACAEALVEPERYESAAQYQAAMAAVLTRHADLDYPVVQASCQRRGESIAEARPPRREG